MSCQEMTAGKDRIACEMCGNPHGTAITLRGRDLLLCPACLQNEVVWEASAQHLKEMMREVYDAWLDAWADNPTYRRQWGQLHDSLAEPFDLAVLAAEALLARGIVPRHTRGGNHGR